MVNEEYRAIMELIHASRDGESDILEKLHEWYGLDKDKLITAIDTE